MKRALKRGDIVVPYLKEIETTTSFPRLSITTNATESLVVYSRFNANIQIINVSSSAGC